MPARQLQSCHCLRPFNGARIEINGGSATIINNNDLVLLHSVARAGNEILCRAGKFFCESAFRGKAITFCATNHF
jgi:hypothetical protein